jgi:hypothetical protein
VSMVDLIEQWPLALRRTDRRNRAGRHRAGAAAVGQRNGRRSSINKASAATERLFSMAGKRARR